MQQIESPWNSNLRSSLFGKKLWILERALTNLPHRFPQDELYNLSSQMRRAVDSIALNISEGSIGQTNTEFKKFIGYSIRSLAEVVSCLHKAKRREYITEDEFSTHYEFAFNLMNMMTAFKEKIK